jgi:hypothetical protein
VTRIAAPLAMAGDCARVQRRGSLWSASAASSTRAKSERSRSRPRLQLPHKRPVARFQAAMVDHHSGLPSRPTLSRRRTRGEACRSRPDPVDGLPPEKRVFIAFARIDHAHGLRGRIDRQPISDFGSERCAMWSTGFLDISPSASLKPVPGLR